MVTCRRKGEALYNGCIAYIDLLKTKIAQGEYETFPDLKALPVYKNIMENTPLPESVIELTNLFNMLNNFCEFSKRSISFAIKDGGELSGDYLPYDVIVTDPTKPRSPIQYQNVRQALYFHLYRQHHAIDLEDLLRLNLYDYTTRIEYRQIIRDHHYGVQFAYSDGWSDSAFASFFT